MKRQNRLIQIEKRKLDAAISLSTAIKSGRQPLAAIKKYPAITMTVSGVLLGVVTRSAIKRPLPGALKLLTIPLFRQVVHQALLLYQKNKQ